MFFAQKVCIYRQGGFVKRSTLCGSIRHVTLRSSPKRWALTALWLSTALSRAPMWSICTGVRKTTNRTSSFTPLETQVCARLLCGFFTLARKAFRRSRTTYPATTLATPFSARPGRTGRATTRPSFDLIRTWTSLGAFPCLNSHMIFVFYFLLLPVTGHTLCLRRQSTR